jgi:DME family drug/metabolite transporter
VASVRATPGTWPLVLASVLWGTTGTAASLLSPDISPLAIGSCTMAVGGVLLFSVSVRAARAALRDPAARRWLLIGALGVVVYPLAFYSAMDQAGVAIGNVVALGSGPVFAAMLEWVWERRRLDRRWLISTAIALVGIALVSGGRHPEASDGGGRVVVGVLLGLLAGLAYALYSYASARAIAAGHRGGAVMGAMFGVGAVPLLGVLVVLGAPLLRSPESIAIGAYLAIGPMFVAYLLFARGMTRLRTSVATSVTLLEPVVATILAVVVVGERLQPAGWFGLACILAGTTVLATARQPAKPPVAP